MAITNLVNKLGHLEGMADDISRLCVDIREGLVELNVEDINNPEKTKKYLHVYRESWGCDSALCDGGQGTITFISPSQYDDIRGRWFDGILLDYVPDGVTYKKYMTHLKPGGWFKIVTPEPS